MAKRKAPEDLKPRKYPKIYPGHRFGRLTVVAECQTPDSSHRKSKDYNRYFFCQCECGEGAMAMDTKLNKGEKTSCGCYQAEVTASRSRKHGANKRGQRTKTYNTWAHVRQRCLNPKNHAYRYYGGRGIMICDRWKDSFENFLADMGEAPSSEHSIDRIDHNGNYEPGNCRWAIKEEQANNKRTNRLFTVDGRTQTLAQWAREKGISPETITQRIKGGMSEKDAINTPRMK